MKNRTIAIGAGILVCVALSTVAGAMPTTKTAQADAAPAAESEAEATTTASVLDGVFTEEQAERGDAVYNDNCQTCHAPNLRGTPGGPSLMGNRFDNRWVGGTVADLYTFIHDNMPAGAGGSLTDDQYIDVTAYILSRRGYPAGDTELEPDPEALSAIAVEEAP